MALAVLLAEGPHLTHWKQADFVAAARGGIFTQRMASSVETFGKQKNLHRPKCAELDGLSDGTKIIANLVSPEGCVIRRKRCGSEISPIFDRERVIAVKNGGCEQNGCAY